jgi:hypothetical protein
MCPPAEYAITGLTTTVILRAEEWNYNMDQEDSSENFVPPLAPLIDALIDGWLHSPKENV